MGFIQNIYNILSSASSADYQHLQYIVQRWNIVDLPLLFSFSSSCSLATSLNRSSNRKRSSFPYLDCNLINFKRHSVNKMLWNLNSLFFYKTKAKWAEAPPPPTQLYTSSYPASHLKVTGGESSGNRLYKLCFGIINRNPVALNLFCIPKETWGGIVTPKRFPPLGLVNKKCTWERSRL